MVKEIPHDTNEAANKTAAILLKLGHQQTFSVGGDGTSVFINSDLVFYIGNNCSGLLDLTSLKRHIAELAAPPKQPQ